MIKKITKLILLTGISFIVISHANSVQAVLQANGNTPATYNIDNWMLKTREMEAAGGALGLSETINSTGLNATSASNNLDVHMEKNTEYGALVILSASAYGNPNKIEDGGTTTGNKSGVVMNLNKEWVAAGTLSATTTYKNAAAKYKNAYTTSYEAKRGDAISETAGWHGSGASTWLVGIWSDTRGNRDSGLLRSYSGSVFSYYGSGFNNGDGAAAYYTKAWGSRAVVVVGSGL